jgi:hypothetical protein
MSNGSELKSPGAMALRAAGYKPCPRWWLTEEQMELVSYMASQNSAEVNRIRNMANGTGVASKDLQTPPHEPKYYEKLSNNGEEYERNISGRDAYLGLSRKEQPRDRKTSRAKL